MEIEWRERVRDREREKGRGKKQRAGQRGGGKEDGGEKRKWLCDRLGGGRCDEGRRDKESRLYLTQNLVPKRFKDPNAKDPFGGGVG